MTINGCDTHVISVNVSVCICEVACQITNYSTKLLLRLESVCTCLLARVLSPPSQSASPWPLEEGSPVTKNQQNN